MKGESRCHAEKSKQTHSPTHPSILIYPILAIDYLLWFWHAYFTFEAQVALSSLHNITVGIPQKQYISPTLFQSREPLKWHCAKAGLMSCICGYVYSEDRLILHVWHVYVVFFLQSAIKDVIQNNHALIECRDYKKMVRPKRWLTMRPAYATMGHLWNRTEQAWWNRAPIS